MHSQPHVSALNVYPIKSCAGIALDEVHFGLTGPDLDRRWMVVTADEDELVGLTQREMPRLAVVQPAITGGELVLRAPGQSSIRVPVEDDRPATRSVLLRADRLDVIDEGLEAAEWFGELLNAEVRLVRLPDRASRRVSPEYAPEPAYTSLTDGYPALLVSEASLTELNHHLAGRGVAPMDMRRFRPNIVVRGVPAYAEDEWRRITLGALPFEVVKPCARCAITTVDPSLGEVVNPHEPLATLATYRKVSAKGKVMFGQNVIHRAEGVLRVGDGLVIEE